MNKKILIVDDDTGIREMLKMLLELEGYEVVVSEKPNETEANIKKNGIDLILLDMLLSGVNGLHVCDRLRQNEDKRVSKVKIVMMSALEKAGEDCKSAGADAFIAKPFDIVDLLTEVDEALREAC